MVRERLLLDQDEEAPGRDRSDAATSGSVMTGDPAVSTLVGVACPLVGEALTSAISAAIAGLYRQFYGHDRTTATTYLNDNVVLCVLEDILTTSESRLVKFGCSEEVIDGRISFQSNTQDAFTAAVEKLTARRVVAFLSANQTTPGCACELFFLDGEEGGPIAVPSAGAGR